MTLQKKKLLNQNPKLPTTLHKKAVNPTILQKVTSTTVSSELIETGQSEPKTCDLENNMNFSEPCISTLNRFKPLEDFYENLSSESNESKLKKTEGADSADLDLPTSDFLNTSATPSERVTVDAVYMTQLRDYLEDIVKSQVRPLQDWRKNDWKNIVLIAFIRKAPHSYPHYF